MKTKIFNLNLILTLILIATGGFFAIRAGCGNKDGATTTPRKEATIGDILQQKVVTPREAAAIADVVKYREKVSDLERENKVLQTEKENFATNLAAVQIEKENFATNLAALKAEISATKVAADLQSKEFTAQMAANQEINSNLFSRLMEAKNPATINTPAPVAPITAPTPTTTTPAANPAPVAGSASASIIAVVTTAANDTVVFYQDGSVISTNTPVGMKDGFPILVDSVSRKTVVLTISRIAKPGSITLEVLSGTHLTVSLLQGDYICSWWIKGESEERSKKITVRGDPPSDLVVGKGIFSGKITLVDR